jgi:hypothetical protein
MTKETSDAHASETHEPPVLDVGQPDPDRRRNLIWGLQTDALFFTRAERRREALAGFCGRMT